MTKKKIISISILTISFIITLLLFQFNEQRYSRLSFKFYHEVDHVVVVEDRYVLLKGDNFKRAETVVDELFLGPMSVYNHKLVPFDMHYNIFYINDKVVYLDMPLKFITNFNEEYYTIEEAVVLIKENILNNISGVNSVILTIEGETMGVGPSKSALPQED